MYYQPHLYRSSFVGTAVGVPEVFAVGGGSIRVGENSEPNIVVSFGSVRQ